MRDFPSSKALSIKLCNKKEYVVQQMVGVLQLHNMSGGETFLQECARKGREASEGKVVVEKVVPKEVVKERLKDVAQPGSLVCNSEGLKRDKGWWKKYRERPVVCPKCGHEFNELRRKKE